MALAIRFESLLKSGAVESQTELAIIGQVTRARVSQIMNLLCLAPDIQEALLFLPRTLSGRDPIRERHVRLIYKLLDWDAQSVLWARLTP